MPWFVINKPEPESNTTHENVVMDAPDDVV
jgi:hypothetical protein